MSSVVDMEGIEKQRQLLEDNLSKLRESLKHWHTWEAEYEGLKEEVDAIAGDTSQANLEQISKTYGGDLVTEKEIRTITGLDQNSPHTRQRINNLITHRQDYVLKNIETLQRQYFAAEGKLEEFAFASVWKNAEPGTLPLTEIHEELDDQDNIISSHTTRPENAQADLINSLRKAGLGEDELEQVNGSRSSHAAHADGLPDSSVPSKSPVASIKQTQEHGAVNLEAEKHEVPQRPPVRKKSVSFTADTKEPLEMVRTDSQEKKVSFAPKVAVMPAADPPDTRQVSFSPQIEEIPADVFPPKSPEAQGGADVTNDIRKDLQASFAPGDKVVEVDENDETIASHIVVPEHESEEDARIRREMLNYHLNEVGSVVAQIDLDEAMAAAEEGDEDGHSTSEFTSSEYMDDEDTPYTSGLSEDDDYSEDEFGRSKGSQISLEYRQRMLNLQNKLIGNIGPTPADVDLKDAESELNPQEIKRLVIRNNRSSISSASSENSDKRPGQKKKVKFAQGLDIAEVEPGPPLAKARGTEDDELETLTVDTPMTDVVAERSKSASYSPTSPSTNSSKTSRFKLARSVDIDEAASNVYHTDTPNGPPGRTLAETLVERSSLKSTAAAPSVADEDPIRDRRELAAEYYRKRNEMIKQQGGFKSNNEDVEDELMEEQDGKVKKVSRFRAARLSGN